jgi:hypothetical protein
LSRRFVPSIRRWLVVLAAAVFCGGYSLWYNSVGGADVRPDFDQFYGAAKALLAGRDPYTSVGPGLWFDFDFPFYYPLPAALIGVPFAWLPIDLARALFAGLGAGVFAFALTRGNDFSRAPALLSGAMLNAIQYGQLSPLLAAGLAYPWLAGLVSVKPSAGLAVVAAQRGWKDLRVCLTVAAALMGISLVVSPGWVPRWTATFGADHLVPPVLRPLGVVLLFALIRWREPVARWLAVLACVPLTSPLYESLPLFMGPWTLRQSLMLALLSHGARWLMFLIDPARPFANVMGIGATITILLVYVPAVLWLVRGTTTPSVRGEVSPTLA